MVFETAVSARRSSGDPRGPAGFLALRTGGVKGKRKTERQQAPGAPPAFLAMRFDGILSWTERRG